MHRCAAMLPIVVAGCMAVGCSGADVTAPKVCGIRLSPVPPIHAPISYEAVAIPETVFVAPDLTLPDGPSRDPMTQATVTGHAMAWAHLRIFDHLAPAGAIPLILFVQGKSAGVDTLVVSTTLHVAGCGDDQTQRIPITVP
jgi:hypothetical protein